MVPSRLGGCPPPWGSSPCVAVLILMLAHYAAGVPNFVIFMADDLGYGDLGFMGNKDIETPNIDRLAEESVFFPNFYVSPVCAPTRASLLTGRNFLRTGVWGVHATRDYINLDETTFANALSDAGYATGMFGKWHSGITDGYLPWHRGFHEACMTQLYHYTSNQAVCNGNPTPTGGWIQDTIADWAKSFVDRKADQPFLLYIPYMTPHLGFGGGGGGEYWHAPQPLVDKYLGKGLSDGLARVYGMVEMMDSSVGAILDHLDSTGVGDNTVVFFFSDNGMTGNDKMHDWWRRNHHGLNGHKGEVYENGIKSPLFVRWRGGYAPGRVNNGLAAVEDIFPTLVELGGASAGKKPVDGISLTSVLSAPESDGVFAARTLFHATMSPEWTRSGGYQLLPGWGTDKSGLSLGRDGRWAVREGNMKYINYNGGDLLYNVVEDPGESHSVGSWDTIQRLKGRLNAWWSSILEDGGSFTTPLFFIGYPSGSGLIKPMGAVEKSGRFTIRSHHVEGNVEPGDYVKFRVIVVKPGDYHVKVSRWGHWGGSLGFEVDCGTPVSAEGNVAGDGFVTAINLPAAGAACTMTMTVKSEYGYFGLDSIWFEPFSDAPSTTVELQSG